MKQIMSILIIAVILSSCSPKKPTEISLSLTPTSSQEIRTTLMPVTTATFTAAIEPPILVTPSLPSNTPTATVPAVPTLVLKDLPGVPIPEDALVTSSFNKYFDAVSSESRNIDVDYKVYINGQKERFIIAVDRESQTPILVASMTKDGKWNWQRATLRSLGDATDMEIGTSVYPIEAVGSFPYSTGAYGQAICDHFNSIWIEDEVQPWFIEEYTNEGILDVKKWVNKCDLRLIIAGLFYHQQPVSKDLDVALKGLKPGTPEYKTLVEMDIRKRLREIVYPNVGGRKPTYIILSNEAVFSSIKNNKVISGWEDDVYYRAFGERLLVEEYLLAYDEAVKAGLKPGVDVYFLYGAYKSFSAGPMLDFTLTVLEHSKNEIAKELNVPAKDVPFGIATQIHMVKGSPTPGHAPVVSKKDLLGAFTRSTEYDEHLLLVETDVIGATQDEISDIFQDIIDSSAEADVKGINLWFAMRDCNKRPDPNWCNPEGALFDWSKPEESYSPTSLYFSIMRSMLNARR